MKPMSDSPLIEPGRAGKSAVHGRVARQLGGIEDPLSIQHEGDHGVADADGRIRPHLRVPTGRAHQGPVRLASHPQEPRGAADDLGDSLDRSLGQWQALLGRGERVDQPQPLLAIVIAKRQEVLAQEYPHARTQGLREQQCRKRQADCGE
jgi:hypothetical protein